MQTLNLLGLHDAHNKYMLKYLYTHSSYYQTITETFTCLALQAIGTWSKVIGIKESSRCKK